MEPNQFAALMQQTLAQMANGAVPAASLSNGAAGALVKSFNDLSTSAYGAEYTGDAAVQGLRETLAKAMGIGDLSAYGVVGTNALQLENLDATMTEVLITEQFMKVFNAIPRVPSKNALYEYNRKKSYGSFRGAAGFREGGAPNGSASGYTRLNATVRYLGERGGVTHQLAVAGGAGGVFLDPTAEENRNVTMRLMAKIERGLVRGKTTILDEDGNTVNYDGIIPQMEASTVAATNVIDLKGLPLSFNNLEDAAYNLFQNGKLLSFAKLRGFATGFVQADLGALLRASERSSLSGVGKPDLIPGTPFGGWNSQFGNIPIEPSQFLDEVEGDQPVFTTADPGAVAAPATAVGTAATNAASLIPTATYYYSAASINSKGESLPLISAGVAVTLGQQVTVAIARVALATGYRLYRGIKSDGTDAKWIGTIPQTVSGAASFVDVNQVRPGAGTYVLFNSDPADICIPQLAPLVKWPLAITSTTVEFLILLYHTMVIKAPERVIVFKNIGKA